LKRVSNEEVDGIFSNIEDLYNFHKNNMLPLLIFSLSKSSLEAFASAITTHVRWQATLERGRVTKTPNSLLESLVRQVCGFVRYLLYKSRERHCHSRWISEARKHESIPERMSAVVLHRAGVAGKFT
jgi:hypothetical protein